jgi:hypothetical protein
VCSGGIVGMGETRADRVGFIHTLATLPDHPQSVPVNALVPVKGTVLGDMLADTPLAKIDDVEFVRTVAVARITMPRSMVRLSAGRESMSEMTQAMCFLAGANSIFTGDKLLTAPNAGDDNDAAMLARLGMKAMAVNQTQAEVEALAASVNDVDDTYLVPAFTGLGAPIWDGHARGTIIGMTRGTTRAHLARAALEGIALQVTGVLNAMIKDSSIALTEIRVDGGASKNNLLMQMQADFLGIPVVRPRITETTALGAAYLAGLAVGFWTDKSVIASQWAVDQRFEPAMSADARMAKLKRWSQALDRARDWAQD